MTIDAIRRTLIFLFKKLFLKVLYGRKIICPFRGKLSNNVNIRIKRKNGTIIFGKRINICSNVEITSDYKGKIIIGDDVFINRNSMIVSRGEIHIGDRVTIGPNTMIYDHNHEMPESTRSIGKISIGSDTWIGANVIILKDVSIGHNVVISAGAIITKDIPDDVIVIQKQTSTLIKRYHNEQ